MQPLCTAASRLIVGCRALACSDRPPSIAEHHVFGGKKAIGAALNAGCRRMVDWSNLHMRKIVV